MRSEKAMFLHRWWCGCLMLPVGPYRRAMILRLTREVNRKMAIIAESRLLSKTGIDIDLANDLDKEGSNRADQ